MKWLMRAPRWILIAGIGAACLALGVTAINAYVQAKTSAYRFTDKALVPPRTIALVFGAGVEANGSPSAMLADRMQAAVDLYKAGRVHKLLLSGDHSRVDYDEVGAMQRYALKHGVPARDIKLDFAGFRTYDSCYRARVIFGVSEALLITHRYHLPRAMYTCARLGISAIGLGVPDWSEYPAELMGPFVVREWLATVVALWQVEVTRPAPTFLGRYEGIR